MYVIDVKIEFIVQYVGCINVSGNYCIFDDMVGNVMRFGDDIQYFIFFIENKVVIWVIFKYQCVVMMLFVVVLVNLC